MAAVGAPPGVIHGTNPENLLEKIVRSRIHATRYWNEECHGLSVETLVDKAVALQEVGGTYGGNKKASRFLCLALKLLQLNPEKEIIIEFIKNDEHRFAFALPDASLGRSARPRPRPCPATLFAFPPPLPSPSPLLSFVF